MTTTRLPETTINFATCILMTFLIIYVSLEKIATCSYTYLFWFTNCSLCRWKQYFAKEQIISQCYIITNFLNNNLIFHRVRFDIKNIHVIKTFDLIFFFLQILLLQRISNHKGSFACLCECNCSTSSSIL